MRVIPGNAQDQGDREGQEDAFGFSSLGDRAFERHGGFMMVLCDGMGGLANGAIASRVAVDAVLSSYARKREEEDILAAFQRVLHEAQEAVCAAAGDGGSAGTTIVIAVVWQDRLYWASLGDSRLYLCREGAPAAQLTADHNVAALIEQRLETAGAGDSDGTTSSREALTAYLGAPYPPKPHLGRDMPLCPGDRIVACSDGLYRGLTPEEIATLARRGPPMAAAERMKAAVLKQRLPHQDNLTITMLEIAPGRTWIQSLHKQVSIRPAEPGPTAWGVLAGFGAAALLVCLLLGFGVLSFGPHTASTQLAAPTATTATVATPTAPPSPPAIEEKAASATSQDNQQRNDDTKNAADPATTPAQGQPVKDHESSPATHPNQTNPPRSQPPPSTKR